PVKKTTTKPKTTVKKTTSKSTKNVKELVDTAVDVSAVDEVTMPDVVVEPVTNTKDLQPSVPSEALHPEPEPQPDVVDEIEITIATSTPTKDFAHSVIGYLTDNPRAVITVKG